jgi:hypothetical protein
LIFQDRRIDSAGHEIGEASDMEIFCIKVFILLSNQPNTWGCWGGKVQRFRVQRFRG